VADKGDALLAEALKAEHAAVFGYGPIGARLEGADRQFATQTEASHRDRRDALLVRLSQKGAPAPAADPTYALPFPVTDQATALQLAIALEEAASRVWRSVLPSTVAEERKLALDALTDCAVRATRFRRLGGVSPVTVPLPGSPT
jgi:hypothetical protein